MLLWILYVPLFDTTCPVICPTIFKHIFQLCSDIWSQCVKIFVGFHSSLIFYVQRSAFYMLCFCNFGIVLWFSLQLPTLLFIIPTSIIFHLKICALNFMRSTFIYGKCDCSWYALNIFSLNENIRTLFYGALSCSEFYLSSFSLTSLSIETFSSSVVPTSPFF